jgi:hypothetical protein
LFSRGVAGTPLHIAAWWGQTEAAAALLEAGASITAVDEAGQTCLTLATWNHDTAAVRLLLQAWQAPPADVLREAVNLAAYFKRWDAAVLLVQQLGKQDMAAAAEVMQAMPDAVPALLDAVLGSEAEQQAAALQDEARRALQVLVLGFAGMNKRTAAGLFVEPCIASSDECSEDECTAGAADGVSVRAVSVQELGHVNAAAANADDDAGGVSVAGGHCRPGITARHVNKRKRGRKVSVAT